MYIIKLSDLIFFHLCISVVYFWDNFITLGIIPLMAIAHYCNWHNFINKEKILEQ